MPALATLCVETVSKMLPTACVVYFRSMALLSWQAALIYSLTQANFPRLLLASLGVFRTYKVHTL